MSTSSKVFFTNLRAGHNKSLLTKIRDLADAAGIKNVVRKNGLTAIKIHFGERGNTAFIRPLLVRPIVDQVIEAGGKPFLTDSGTLYVGTRGNAFDHLTTAVLNGFDYSVVGAPLVIADGIDGRDEVAVPLDVRHCKEAFIGSAFARADSIISLAHFKLHEVSGFGGAIKNVGMGTASRKGKMAQHCDVAPKVEGKNCIGCGLCIEECAQGAITLVDRPADVPRPKGAKNKVSRIDQDLCAGCARCVHACLKGAIEINWKTDLSMFMERMVEYTLGALKGKEDRSLFLNFLTQITPACDCYPFSDAPIVGDIGIMASTDPVAIDQASVDMLNAQPVLESSCLKDSELARTDKITAVYPKVDWRHQLDYAVSLGLGSREYELTTL